ncbi:MAG: aminotransferase class I/II-fold pyridoxal phosphate-dependent enzyme, partial [Nitrososphaeraceae archaeon]
IKNALIKAVQNNENFYTASEGLPELRQAIVEKEKGKGFDVTENYVLVTNGVSEGLDMIMASIVDPNSEVLMSGPYYPPYASYVKFYGGKPVEFKNPRLILKLVQSVLLINTETFQKQNSLLFQYSFNLL